MVGELIFGIVFIKSFMFLIDLDIVVADFTDLRISDRELILFPFLIALRIEG